MGHSDTFWSYEPKASTRLLNTYLDTGKVDTSLYTPAKVDFTPEVTQTALGKGFAGTMLGLPVVVILSLLLMWRRVRRRGRFGRTSSVLLRSLYTLVLGLGGWFAGVVIVQFAFPAVPLDDVRLAVLSIVVPIGLGIYLAWVNRDLSAGARTIGFWAATSKRARRRLAGVPHVDRADGRHHDDRGSGRRRQPGRPRFGHLMASAGSRPFCRNDRERDAGGAPVDGLKPTRS
jgi:hypothetical protein